MSTGQVFDVSAENFQSEVLERSAATPVLLDFWAEWCEPCRTIGPILEKLAGEFGGSFVVGKVDTEKEPELAQAFGVQGIPFCVLMQDGRPADAFQGAVPEAEVRRFLERAGIAPAAGAEVEAEVEGPDDPGPRLQRAVRSAVGGDVASARAALEGFPDDDERRDAAERLRDGLAFLEAPLDDGAAGAEGELAQARQHFLSGEFEPAMERILAAVATDKSFRSGLGRRAMLLCFLVLSEDARCDEYRRRLATLLY